MKQLPNRRRVHLLVWTAAVALTVTAMYPAETLGAQSRIDPRVTERLMKHDVARVLIVVAPPKVEGGFSHAFNHPRQFVQGILEGSGSKVRQIGSLPIAVADVNNDGMRRLSENELISAIFLDEPHKPFLHDSLPLMNVDAMHESAVAGAEYSIAIVDTGVNYDHPFLKGKLLAEGCFSTRRNDTNAYTVKSLCPNEQRVDITPGSGLHCEVNTSECSHGTHVAGIALGGPIEIESMKISGVAHQAGLIAIQTYTEFKDSWVCDGPSNTPCVRTFVSDQLNALDYVRTLADKHDIAAVNLSLGGSRSEAECDTTDPRALVIENLRAMGIATVIASGNNGYYNAVTEPACVSSAITVGASKAKSTVLNMDLSNTSDLVDFLAPGTRVTSSGTNGFEEKTGTSMAAPHMAGVIALLRSHVPKATVDQMELALEATATKTKDPCTNVVLHFPNVSKAADTLKQLVAVATPERATEIDIATAKQVEAVLGAPRIIVVFDGKTIRDMSVRQQMLMHVQDKLGTKTLVRTSGPNRLIIENRDGFQASELGYVIQHFGDNTKLYKDGLGSTQ